jgi:hypothetical protein
MKRQLLFILGLSLIASVAISQPTITSFTPVSGPVGTSVTITGTNFSTTAANNIVFFGATKASVTAASTSQLTVTVPVGATYQPITVLVGGLIAYSAKPFIVTFANGAGIDATSLDVDIKLNTGVNPFTAILGDLDGDGMSDIVLTNYASNTISLFRNTSTLGLVSFIRVGFSTGTINPSSVSLGDLDGDGMTDIAVTNSGSNTVSVYRNTSTLGSFSYATKVDFTTGTFPYSVSIADLDGDCKLDLGVANLTSNTISLFRNTSTIGTISYAAKVDVATAASPISISIGDIDGDIKPDMIVANSGANSVSVFRNTSTLGTFTFATKTDFTAGSAPNSVSIGDLDNDGKIDLAVANRLGNSISVFRNTSTVGLISFATNIDFTTNTGPYNVAIGDLDGDGKIDIATANYLSNSLSLFKNMSISGTISFATKVDNAGGAYYSIAIGDLDGDGKADLASTNFNEGRLSVFRNATRLNQTITFGALASKTFGDIAYTLTGTSSSGLPINYTSSNASVATVSGNIVTIVGGGTTTITAAQVGDATYAAATSVQQTLTINKANQTITFGALATKTFGDETFNLSATSTSTLPISYSSSNTAVATVSGSTLTIVGAGTATITASQSGNTNYNPATNVQQTLAVTKANQTITFGALASKTFGDGAFNLTAAVSSSLVLSYGSSNTAVATVSGNTVTIVGAGTTTITASQAGNANYNPASNVQQTLTVNKADQTITFGSLVSKTVGDASFVLTGTASSGLAVTYTSSNSLVAALSGSTVTINGLGNATISASQSGNSNYNPAADVLQELIVKENQTITFGTISDKTLGDAVFSLAATSSSSLAVSFSSTSNKISISGNQVTLVSAGRATVTALQAGNINYNPATSVDQSFCIKPAKPTITLSNSNTASPTLTSSATSGNQWYLNGTAISGATNATLQITQAGVYKVQVQIDDCISSFSDDQALIVTAVEPGQINELEVYPNPAREELVVNLKSFEINKPVTITVMDLLGRMHYNASANGGDHARIDIRTYPSGNYVLLLQQGKSHVSKTFIKSF